jgi:hypothetical protein
VVNFLLFNNDKIVMKYVSMFRGPLSQEAIAAIREATRLGDGNLTEAAAALASEELAARAEEVAA